MYLCGIFFQTRPRPLWILMLLLYVSTYILLDIIAPLARSVLNALSISKCWSHYYHDDDGVKPVGVKSSEPWDASKWPTAKRRTL